VYDTIGELIKQEKTYSFQIGKEQIQAEKNLTDIRKYKLLYNKCICLTQLLDSQYLFQEYKNNVMQV
jgi:hypothetical protein